MLSKLLENISNCKMEAKFIIILLILFKVYKVLSHNSTQFSADLQYNQFCHNSEYCVNEWDPHSVCVPSLRNVEIKECHCFPNYKKDIINKTCQEFNCFEDEECQEWDLKRVCRSGRCVCVATYEEQFEYMFLCVHTIYEAPTSLLWLWLLFVVPIIAVLTVIIMNIYKCRVSNNRFRY
jgi:hypothetical protein